MQLDATILSLQQMNHLSANGQNASAPLSMKGHKAEFTEAQRSSFRVRVDYRKVFNAMVVGLFAGEKPPFLAASQRDIPRCVKGYEVLAAKLRLGDNPRDYYRCAQAASLLKKLENAPFGGPDPEVVALEGWRESEEICKEVNRRLWELKNAPVTLGDSLLGSTISGIREELMRLLGPLPPDYCDVAHLSKFGPGTSLSHKTDEVDPILKTINPSILPTLQPEYRYLEESMMGECIRSGYFGAERVPRRMSCDDMVQVYNHARLTTVPKNFNTNRCIEIGGSLSTWIQQSYDGFIRQRLKQRWGLDLGDQRPNQRMARIGSLDRSLCTIDLTSASDRLAYGLVVSVLSPAWARCLTACTNRFVMDGDTQIGLEKFSAMGNALTFSLQTAIFGGIVRSVLRDRGMSNAAWRVYGDDIIVPLNVYDDVMERLRVVGCSPNPLKSYAEGNFRESCGVDYLLGCDVRPLFIRKPLETVADLIKCLNQIQIQINKCPLNAGNFQGLYSYLKSLIPEDFRIYGVPSRYLSAYIWIPGVHCSCLEGLPRYMLAEGVRSGDCPEIWAYRRALLTGECGDSSVRRTKFGSGKRKDDNFIVTHKRPGYGLPGSSWLWLKSPKLFEARKGFVSQGVNPFLA